MFTASTLFSARFWNVGLLIALAASLSGCGGDGSSGGGSGSSGEAIRFVFTPSVERAKLEDASNELMVFLSEAVGQPFEAVIPATYSEAVKAFGEGGADVGLLNSFGYLMAHREYGAEAYLKGVRYGEAYYLGQLVTHAESGIKTIDDFNGKKIAYTSPTSASGYLFPAAMLARQGIEPGETMFAGTHDEVVRKVYNGEVDAGATYHEAESMTGEIRDARARVLKQYPDVAEKVVIVEKTDFIPNDPVCFRQNMSEALRQQIIEALFRFSGTREGKDVLGRIGNLEGFDSATDQDYDGLRRMLQSLDIEAASLLEE